MTTAALHRGTRRRTTTVELAGTAWPLYKLEAVVTALVIFLLALVVTHVLQTAVLYAAGAAVVVWWVRRLMLVRPDAPTAWPPT